ncbi:hypothetical protein [Thalassolituus oleivorans]|uniref:hypothetical protein n=1 Tax=Thalassolituus oleivorans TaxID=187493 RepID=UPI0023F001B9|nr:hypothetical protein [Thalassolituus oleivorans]|tara:strand:- start:35608 stop:35844 length:237 start_codon:yes stop_codon:yes gene_type:complete
MTINYSDLEQWSITAASALKEIIEAAQAATDEPFGDSECADLRSLLEQHERIMDGVELWQKQLIDCGKYDTGAKLILD